jgi:spore germination protein
MLLFNDKVSIRQLQVLLILDIFGTGVTALPRVVSVFAGQNGWLCVIIATAMAAVCAYLITAVAQRFPGKTFFAYTSALLTRPVGVLLTLAFVIKMALMSAYELRFFGEIVRQTLLEKTPFGIICAGMLLLAAYAASKGYETRARIAEILIFIVFLPLIFVAAIVSSDVDFSNLLPVMTAPTENILSGAGAAFFAFSGLEFCLLCYPYLNRPKTARKSVIRTVLLIGALMTVITVVSIARFGPAELRRTLWPVIAMMDATTLPGSFLERQGAMIMSFWIVSVFAFVNAGLFFSSLLLKDVCGKGNHSTYILILIPVIFGLSLIPENIVQLLGQFAAVNQALNAVFVFLIPLILLIAAKLRKAGDAV